MSENLNSAVAVATRCIRPLRAGKSISSWPGRSIGSSPEGRARSRIFVLKLKSFSSSGLSDAETEELESLRKVYPDLPPDPNDPMYEPFQAYGRAAAEHREKVESRRAHR
jgi:hypothetical protein